MDFEISPGQVKALQKSGATFTLLDVREPWECAASRIEGAKHIPMGDIPTRAHQELDPDHHIVVLCHHGVRSLSVTKLVASAGIRKCSIHARRNRRLGADSGSESAVVLGRYVRSSGPKARMFCDAGRQG